MRASLNKPKTFYLLFDFFYSRIFAIFILFSYLFKNLINLFILTVMNGKYRAMYKVFC